MLVPDQLIPRACDIADPRAPGGSPEMHDGSEKRTARSRDGVNVDRIELLERGTWLARRRQGIGGGQNPRLLGPPRAQLPATHHRPPQPRSPIAGVSLFRLVPW